MKAILFTIIFTLGIYSSVLAKDKIKDPIYDFLFDDSDINKLCFIDYLNTIYVLRLDLDNNNHAFVLITFNGYGSRDGNFWEAYIPEDGGYQKAKQPGDRLYFRMDRFYVGYVDIVKKYGLLAYAPGKGGGELNFFQIVNGKVTGQKVGNIDFSKAEDKKTLEKYFGKAHDLKSLKEHPVTKMSLDDLRKAGYDVDAAISAAKSAIAHPKQSPIN